MLDDDIPSACFLDETEKLQATQRLRAKQIGTGTKEFGLYQVIEAKLEVKIYVWISMTILLSIGAGVANVFGPLILSSLGLDKYPISLLNMPFTILQLLVILP